MKQSIKVSVLFLVITVFMSSCSITRLEIPTPEAEAKNVETESNKGNTVYVFTPKIGSDKCSLAVFSFDGNNFNPITASSLPEAPECHCKKHDDDLIPSDRDLNRKTK